LARAKTVATPTAVRETLSADDTVSLLVAFPEEAAKPDVDRGKEAAERAYENALRLAKELVEKSRSEGSPNNE
jgi:hypothetical protein